MSRLALLIAVVLAAPTLAFADARHDEAARWIDTLVHAKKPEPVGSRSIEIVLDVKSHTKLLGGTVFAADSPCSKLGRVAKATDADLATLATCLSQAAQKLGLDKTPVSGAKALRDVGATYLVPQVVPPVRRGARRAESDRRNAQPIDRR